MRNPDCTLCHDAELGWCAGFFDGEGSTWVNSNTLALHMSISQREPKTLLRFQAAVGIGSVVGPYKAGKETMKDPKPRYRWQIARDIRVHRVLDLLWPYLSEEKKLQAKQAMDKQLGLKQSRLEGNYPRKYYGKRLAKMEAKK